jgi:pimeloyl-ACP methyl ester carboxylesterase
MTDEWEILRRLAAREDIAFEPARLPIRKWQTLPSGIRLSYLDWPGDGPIALFLHGGAMTAHTFDLVCLDLSDRYHCVALELRGHGDSDAPQDKSIGAMANDIAAFNDVQNWSRLNLVGMSLGGCVAGHFAATDPGRLASLAFIDVGPTVNFESTASMRQFFNDVPSGQSVEQLVDRAMASSRSTDRDKIHYRFQRNLKVTPAGVAWKMDRRRSTDFEHILGKLSELAGLASTISCPVLVVKGGASVVLTDNNADAFARTFPNGRWQVLEGASHNVQEDRPKDLANLLRGHFTSDGTIGSAA